MYTVFTCTVAPLGPGVNDFYFAIYYFAKAKYLEKVTSYRFMVCVVWPWSGSETISRVGLSIIIL